MSTFCVDGTYHPDSKPMPFRWVGDGLPGPVRASLRYDLNGNMTSVTGTEFGSKTLVYDDENRLTSITYGGVTDTYTYATLRSSGATSLRSTSNWQGLRTRAVINGVTYRYLYNGERVLQELTDAGGVNATYTTENDSYYGALLHLKRTTGESRFPLYDEIGSARGLVDASGAMADTSDMVTLRRRASLRRPVATTGTTANPFATARPGA
jgi:hypothetical protein